MLSPEFEASARLVVKCPADFVIPTLRQMGVGEMLLRMVARNTRVDLRRRLGPAAVAAQAMRMMGMYLLFPPDVAGWNIGQAWVTSATMIERLHWAASS